ncbi:MAG TPA: hypothetical protein VIY55_15600 [Acetobacteraceae bacterium]|jgi:hypothetical protein
MIKTGMSLNKPATENVEPNHRRELALEGVELAVEELAMVLLAELANVAIELRKPHRKARDGLDDATPASGR